MKSFALVTASSPFPRRWNPYTHPDAPLRWRKPQTVKVTLDLFDHVLWNVTEDVKQGIDRIFAVMALCPQHAFFLPTERPGRMREYLARVGAETDTWRDRWDSARRWLQGHLTSPTDRRSMGRWEYVGVMMAYQKFPLPNVVLGTVIRTQADADERIPELLECPAAYRYVEVEPREAIDLLKPGYLAPVTMARTPQQCDMCGAIAELRPYGPRGEYVCFDCGMKDEAAAKAAFEGKVLAGPFISWLHIAGGREPVDIAWIRSLIAQADAAGVPVWVSALGSHIVADEIAGRCGNRAEIVLVNGERDHWRFRLRSRNGSNPEEWPSDLVRRSMPEWR